MPSYISPEAADLLLPPWKRTLQRLWERWWPVLAAVLVFLLYLLTSYWDQQASIYQQALLEMSYIRSQDLSNLPP